MSGTRSGGLKAAQKNLASNPNFYAEIGRKGGSATFASHGSCKVFAHDNRELKDVIHLLILAGGNEIPNNHYGVLRDAGN